MSLLQKFYYDFFHVKFVSFSGLLISFLKEAKYVKACASSFSAGFELTRGHVATVTQPTV